MTKISGMVAAILALVGPSAFGQDSLMMTCAQHGTGAMTLKFVREAGAARNVEVIGQTSNQQWTVKVNGQTATPPTQTLNSPGVVAVHVADTITFKVENPRHGILFLSEELAQAFLEFDEAAGKPLAVRPPKGEFDWGTEKFNGPNDILAVAKVRAGSAVAPPASEEKLIDEMSPSMQRRLLRFVNRAYTPEDLMKSSQEIRARSEHAPPKPHGSASDAKAGFARPTAEALIKGRPLDGYRDIRDCIPAYRSSGINDLRGVIDSIGPSEFGKWETINGTTPSVMHAAMMHNGKVLFITNTTDTCLWDTAGPPQVLTGSATGLNEILYCSGHSFLSDGHLLAVGGGGSDPGAASSIHGWKFNPDDSKWSRTSGNMASRRWYPTAVTLGDEPGRVLVAAGLMDRFGTPAQRMEVYSETTDTFEEITAAGPVGNLLFQPTYPGLHLLPGGEIFHAPTGFNDCDQAPITSGAVADPTAIFRFTSDTAGAWTTLGQNNRLKGMSAVLYDTTFPFVQGFVAGGGEGPKNGTGQTIDLTSMSPAWSRTFPLHEERVHPNLVVLPDGTVFICGGKTAGTTTPPNGGKCELFDPKTGLTTEMDELNQPRHYHSVALLLPDARVMVAGGAIDDGCTISRINTIEVFRPPYLFRGSQPVISSAPKFVDHGGTITIKTPAASQIGRVVLARPAAVTHQTDSEQRILPLSFRVTAADTIEATAPGTPGAANPIAPRGHYMLFILNEQGVPSVSTWIRVQ